MTTMDKDPIEEDLSSSTGKKSRSTYEPLLNKESKSFLVPIKSMGRVVDSVVIPSLYHRGGMWFCAVSTSERTFSILSLDTLQTVFFGSIEFDDGLGRIQALASIDDITVVVSSSKNILCYSRGNLKWKVYSGLEGDILRVFLFEEIFIVVTRGGVLHIRSSCDGSLVRIIDVQASSPITVAIHPNTLINMILLGFSDGHMELWNVKASSQVHRFRGFAAAISCISQSPEADIIAVGLENGTVIVQNIRSEQELGRFVCATSVSSVEFRFDSPSGDVQIMTAESNGVLTIWSINERARPIGKIGAHSGPILVASFLSAQPIIVSWGANDNSIKEWIVEAEGRELRLLRSREGPHFPITNIHFYDGQEQAELVCAGGDESVVGLSLGLDTKFHRTKIMVPSKSSGPEFVPSALKVRNVSTFTANVLGWDDAVVLFDKLPYARTFNKRKNANGAHFLISPDNQPLNAGKMSACGHFCVLGSFSGGVSIFNMQSGQLRGSFHSADGASIIEVAFDNASRHIVALSISGLLTIYEIKQKTIIHSEPLGFFVKKAVFKHDTGMLFILADDYSVRLYSLGDRRIVRILEPSQGIINDFAVSSDSKWLVSCTPSNGSLCTLWDLVSGIEVCKIKMSCSLRCIAISPDGEFLATVPVGCNYADLWWFLPNSAALTTTSALNSALSASISEGELMLSLSRGSTLALSTFINWQTLREQNKPKVPVKKSSTAPFFLSELAKSKVVHQQEVESEKADEPKTDQQLSPDSSDEDIRQFLLEAPAVALCDEFSLCAPDLVIRIARAICALSVNPLFFDRSLAVLSIFIRSTPLDAAHEEVEKAANNLRSIWSDCGKSMHSALNIIRFLKGQHKH